MKNAIQKFLKNRLRLVKWVLGLYIISAAVFLMAARPSAWGFVLYLVAAFVAIELVLRLALRFVYGQHYYYALFSYFIVDHPVYGYGLHKNSSSTQVPFPIFDKFAFKAGAEPSLELAENKKQRVDFNVNSLGFRGPEFSPTKRDPDTIRIFASGDSTTVCAFNDDQETWPAALERELKNRGINAEVINAGVGAWPLYQQRLRLEREIVNLEPDIVLLHAGWNEEFMFSMQNLGRNWQPQLFLNAVEIKTMYARVGPILSSTLSLFFHSLVASFFYDIRFKKNMDFINPARWACLKAPQYLENWFDNLVSIAQTATTTGIKLYTINPPGLTNIDDSISDRDLYTRSTRLTPAYADYQAVSKKRVQNALLKVDSVVPCIDVEKGMQDRRGPARLELFFDKIHLSPKGNELLAKIVADQLMADKNFLQKGSNASFDAQIAESVRETVGVNSAEIEAFIEKYSHAEQKN